MVAGPGAGDFLPAAPPLRLFSTERFFFSLSLPGESSRAIGCRLLPVRSGTVGNTTSDSTMLSALTPDWERLFVTIVDETMSLQSVK